jgi:hypothetical protein
MNGRLPGTAVLLAALACGPVAAAAELPRDLAAVYEAASISPPDARQMTVCYGFVCRRRAILYFTAADRAALSGILAAGRASPAAERKAVQRAVAWFDRRVGPMIGTTRRVARADFRHDARENFDCHDTMRNTLSLLLVLREWGLLRHHAVGSPRFRGSILLGQTPHNTAVLRERASGREWAVDMWTRAYGELPDVMTLEQWLREK